MLMSKGNVTVLLLTTGGMWCRLSFTARTTAVTSPSTADWRRAWRTDAAACKGGVAQLWGRKRGVREAGGHVLGFIQPASDSLHATSAVLFMIETANQSTPHPKPRTVRVGQAGVILGEGIRLHYAHVDAPLLPVEPLVLLHHEPPRLPPPLLVERQPQLRDVLLLLGVPLPLLYERHKLGYLGLQEGVHLWVPAPHVRHVKQLRVDVLGAHVAQGPVEDDRVEDACGCDGGGGG